MPPLMVEIRDRRLIIDGKPRLLFAGEVHYFRLRRDEWEDRIVKAQELGCNVIATYVPWVVHEQKEGEFKVQDVADFADLCHRHGLWFIPRPGPFVMAEMKNEGIPHWVYQKHPDAVPVSWKGEKAVTPTLDYLNEGFLAAVAKWYGAVMPIFAKRLQQNGGPVIGMQLDNEIGMLQWVTNQPDLSEDTLCDFAKWAVTKYGNGRYPFDLNDPVARTKGLREPTEAISPRLLRDYGDYERDRFARYVATLRGYAEEHGVRDVPFIVNIHGSGGGRGTQFPIGIHQLYQSYGQATGYLSGSDHYLGELTRDNASDLHFINAFMAATNRPEQPLTSMEFEVGSGDYGETGGTRMSPAAADMKVRLSIAQGNRLLNYYLLAGGRNPLLETPPHDGNDRIGNNGERHGFAAPIDPEGNLAYTYGPLSTTTHRMLGVEGWLADMDEELDNVALAFLPDYYKTDLHRPGPMRQIVENLEGIRENLATITRTMLHLGYRYSAVDLQHRAIRSKGLVFASSRHLDPDVQTKLVEYVRNGGHLLLFGELPHLDMEGQPCTILGDALGIRHREWLQASSNDYLSLQAQNEPEIRAWRAESVDAPSDDAFLRVVGKNDIVGVQSKLGTGKAIFLGANYPFHPGFYRSLFARLGLKAAIQHDAPDGGVLMNSLRNRANERFLSLINLDHEAKQLEITENGHQLFPHRASVTLRSRESRLLPIGLRYRGVTLRYATVEIMRADPEEGVLYLKPAPNGVVVFEGTPKLGVLNHEPHPVEGGTLYVVEEGQSAIFRIL